MIINQPQYLKANSIQEKQNFKCVGQRENEATSKILCHTWDTKPPSQ